MLLNAAHPPSSAVKQVGRRMFEAPSYAQLAFGGRREPSSASALVPLAAIDFRKLCATLWRGKATIFLAMVVALAMAAAFVVLAPRKYTATTQILVDPMELHAVPNELTSTNQQSDAATLTVESQVSVITSDSVLRRVIAAEDLEHDPEFARGASAQKYGPLAALNELKRHIAVTHPERTYVLNVSVTSKDPAKAARIANAVAQAYLAEQTQVRADTARQVSRSLSARLKELQSRVRDAEQRVETYKAEHNIVNANGELVNEQQLASLNTQLVAARARTADAKARLDQIETVQRSKAWTGAFPAAVQSQTIAALRSQYADVVRREAEQRSSLGDRHPAVIEIEAQADRLQKMIADEVNRLAQSAHTEYESAKAQEEALSRNLEALKQTALSTDQSMVGLRELQRDVAASRAVYESFLVRARETSEQEQVDTKNIRVISNADMPLQRSSPPSTMLIALAALVLGAASGAGLTLMRASGDESPAPAPAPALPRQPLRQRLAAATRQLFSASVAPHPAARSQLSAIPVLATFPPSDVAFSLDAVHDPDSAVTAAITKVYEAIGESPRTRGNPSVLVAACDDEDDSTAVALCLAAAAAAKERVLLIDADLERRTLSAIDADRSDAGLVDVATGRRELSDVIVRDRDTNINAVSLVSSRSRRNRPISDADIVRAFRKTERFDMVIVTTLDPARNPTTRFFARLVDHIVLVATADEAGERAAEEFVSQLGPDASKLRGAVLTGLAVA